VIPGRGVPRLLPGITRKGSRWLIGYQSPGQFIYIRIPLGLICKTIRRVLTPCETYEMKPIRYAQNYTQCANTLRDSSMNETLCAMCKAVRSLCADTWSIRYVQSYTLAMCWHLFKQIQWNRRFQFYKLTFFLIFRRVCKCKTLTCHPINVLISSNYVTLFIFFSLFEGYLLSI